MRVFLVGMMGVGKSTVGPRAAARLSQGFVDLDREIERMIGQSVNEIFLQEGEAAFRSVEARVLRGLAEDGVVVATGGGTACDPTNLAFLRDTGRVIYLRASPHTLVARLADAERPLLDGATSRLTRLEMILAARRAAYEAAHHIIDTDGCSPEEVADAVAELVGPQAMHGDSHA
jgi:shikimate kinase